jgi:hypothetical protein
MGDNSNRNRNTCSFYTNSANNKWEITQIEIQTHAVYTPIQQTINGR